MPSMVTLLNFLPAASTACTAIFTRHKSSKRNVSKPFQQNIGACGTTLSTWIQNVEQAVSGFQRCSRDKAIEVATDPDNVTGGASLWTICWCVVGINAPGLSMKGGGAREAQQSRKVFAVMAIAPDKYRRKYLVITGVH